MKRHAQISRRLASSIWVLLFVIALPRIVFADVEIALVPPAAGESRPRLDMTLVGMAPRAAVPIQHTPTLISPTWVVSEVLITDASGNASTSFFVDPTTPEGQRHFFRAVLPVPQINLLQPYVISTGGGVFYIIGQLFDPSFTVWIDGVLVASAFIDSNTIQVNAGPLSAGFHTITLRDSLNNVIATLSNGLLVTSTGRTDQESPPAAPVINDETLPPPCLRNPNPPYNPNDPKWHSTCVRLPTPAPTPPEPDVIAIQKHFLKLQAEEWARAWNLRWLFLAIWGSFDDVLRDTRPRIPPVGPPIAPPSAEGRPGSVSLASWTPDDYSGAAGNVQPPLLPVYCDLDLSGGGWTRTAKLEPLYAVPRVAESTGELFLESVDLNIPGRGLDLVWARTYRSKAGLDTAMGSGWDFSYNIRAAQSGSHITVQDGQNRTDTYFLQSDGSYSNDELFRRGTLAGQVFTLQFADKTTWLFKPLDGSPTSGKIDKIIDRNANQLQFQYNGSGRLFIIVDTLGRLFQIIYDGPGRIQSVQDFSGRTIQYTYHNGIGSGGSLGDLLSVRSQAVTGTPIGNDFLSGKVAQFTYSFGFGDAGRNHNLLTAKDGNNVQWFQATYTTSTNPIGFNYDRVATEIIGTNNETKVFTSVVKTPNPGNRFNTSKTIVNDAIGNVHESLFDSNNRLIDLRRFTGRSTPGVAVTEGTNRPLNPVRPTDPAYFQTTIDWNRDSLPTHVTFPRSNGVEMVYERDFDSAVNPRERANLRVLRQLPVSGAPLVERFEYQPGFGTGEGQGSALRICDGLSGASSTRSRGRGDSGTRNPGVSFTCGPSGVMSIMWCPVPIDLADPGGNRAVYNIASNGGSYVDPTDDMTLWALYGKADRSDLGQRTMYTTAPDLPFYPIGGSTLRVERASPGDLGLPEFSTLDTDARGFTWTCTRDANGNATGVTRPDGVTTDIEHNANGQLTAIVRPPNHTGHRERDEWHYYSSPPQTGYLQSFVRDAGGLNLTTGFTHNSVGCVTQIVDPRGHDAQFFVNQLNQVVQVISRDAGGGVRYLTNIFRDANNRITSVDVQNKDEFGVVGANAFFTTSFGYDSLDHVTSMTGEVDSGHTVTTQYFYDAIRELIEVRSPLAVSAAEPDARVQYAYDERRLLFTATAAPGSGIATGSTYTYDENGNLTKNETGAPAGTHHFTTAIYDGFDRLTQRTDPVGTQYQFTYNNNHQPLTISIQGSLLDANGNSIFGLLGRMTCTYDTSSNWTRSSSDWFEPITGIALGDGSRTTTIARDPTLNVIGITDDNSHTLVCSYDDANRLSRVTDPKDNRVDYSYDANGNIVTLTRTDKSDTAAPDHVFTLTKVYDALDRLITSTDNVGNANGYLYDSRSNPVRHVDPRNNLTQCEYDGLERLTRKGRDMNANSSGFDVNDIVLTSSYDDNSRLIGRNDPNSHATQYTYDALTRLTRRDNADGTFKTWGRDAWGNATQSNDENGTVCVNNFDNLNRLKQRQITPGAGVSSATTSETYDYPADYLIRERAVNNATVVRCIYDSLGQVTSERLGNRTTTYAHDGAGNLLSMQSPGGRVVTYTYDTANLCTNLSLTATSDGDSLGSIAVYKYIGGRVESVNHRNGTSTAYTYDGFAGAPVSSDLGWGQLAASVTTGPGSVVLDHRTFIYDAAQNLSERRDTRTGGPQLLHHYDYDAANRNVHTQVNSPGPTLVRDTIYNYDRNGNRIAVNGLNTPDPGVYIQDATTPAPADAQMNQYTSTPLGNYSYDANGNRINLNGGGANTNYKYDYRNRLVDLTNVNTGLRIANYQYDALDRRIQKTLDPDGTPNVINFIYSGRTVLEERDGGGAVTAAYSAGGGGFDGVDVIPCPLPPVAIGDGFVLMELPAFSGPVEMRRAGNNFTYHTEGVPWLWLMTNPAGAAAERYDYQDFGDPHFFNGSGSPLSSSAIGNPYLFKGMRFDGESGLYLSNSLFWPDRDHDGFRDGLYMFDPKIGASLQRESSHAVNAYSGTQDNGTNGWSGFHTWP